MARNVERPEPYRWPNPITMEQYEALMPAKLELVNGYMIGGPESKQARLDLLALLLTNCGLEDAVTLASRDEWREAMDRSHGGC